MEASKEGRSLADFRYGCVGYSVYSDMKNNSGDAQESEKELPVCVGIEVLSLSLLNVRMMNLLCELCLRQLWCMLQILYPFDMHILDPCSASFSFVIALLYKYNNTFTHM